MKKIGYNDFGMAEKREGVNCGIGIKEKSITGSMVLQEECQRREFFRYYVMLARATKPCLGNAELYGKYRTGEMVGWRG